MPHAYGYRAQTRDLFKKGFRRHGAPNLTTFLTPFKKGDFVDIVGDGAAHKGMPHKIYHGRTGRVFNVNPNAIGVIVNKQVRNRVIPKRIHVRVEHIKQSKCQLHFKERVKQLEAEKRNNKGQKQARRRLPEQPRGEFLVETNKAKVIFQNPQFSKEIF